MSASAPAVTRRGRALRWLVALVVVAGGAVLVWREAGDLGEAVRRLSVGRVVVAGLAALAGTVLVERCWAALLAALGVAVPPRDAASMFYVTQLGKYVPGSVWPVLAQMQFGTRWGAPRRLLLAANVLLLVLVTGTGVAVGAALLPWSSPGGLDRYWWLLLLLVPLLVALHPRVVPGLLDAALGRLGREPLGVRLAPPAVARATGWMLAAWACLGVQLVALLGAYEPVGVRHVAAAVGGMALAWAAGIAFLPAPAGAGVREGVLVMTLAPLVGTTEAVTVALASRVVLLLADVLLAGLGAVGRCSGLSPS